MHLSQFVKAHPPAGPRKAPENEDQIRLLAKEDGVFLLSAPPFPSPAIGRPGLPEGRHLWVIVSRDLPIILETAPNVRPPPLQSGVAKHTNLTGGGSASSGGELWVDAVANDLLYVNGGSGRYGPQSAAELDDAVHVFRGFGFRVESAGWDEDLDMPARTFRRS